MADETKTVGAAIAATAAAAGGTVEGDDLQPIVAELASKMNTLARYIDAQVQPYAFALLVFPVGAPGRVNYIGNGNKADMIKAMREWADRAEKNLYDGALHKMPNNKGGRA